jgi:hypothetical protein
MPQPNNAAANPAPPPQPPATPLPAAVKQTYVAQWHADGQLYELPLTAAPDLSKGLDELAKIVCAQAVGIDWLLDGEALHFVSIATVDSETDGSVGITRHKCTYVRFAFCPSTNPQQRQKNVRKRNPESVESIFHRGLTIFSTIISVIMIVLVFLQLDLLRQQNNQFDEALRKFESVVQAYLWQVNTPALGAKYLEDTSDIELTNYGLTPISISKATLVTSSQHSSLLAYGVVYRLREGEAQRISTLRPEISGPDMSKEIAIEIIYIYLGNPYKLTWPAKVQFNKDGTPRIVPQGETPTVTPITR